MAKKPTREPEVKGRLLVAIGDRLEHSARALKTFLDPKVDQTDPWVMSMLDHWGLMTTALLSLHDTIKAMNWPMEADNEQALEQVLGSFEEAAIARRVQLCSEIRAGSTAEERAMYEAAKKQESAVAWVFDMLFPNVARPSMKGVSDGQTQTQA